MRISDGSSDVCSSDLPDARVIRRMARQEERHREILDKLLAERGVRPTAMQPLWDVAGFALGAATALMGPRAAMACTAAVETEIERHYNEQLDAIGDHDPELTAHLSDFRDRAEERRVGKEGGSPVRTRWSPIH